MNKIIGFRKENLNKDYNFSTEEPVYKDVCDICYLNNFSIIEKNELDNILIDYKLYLNTLNDIDEDGTIYIIDKDTKIFEVIDVFLHLDTIPFKTLINMLDGKLINYLSKMMKIPLFFGDDIRILSFIINHYKKTDEIYLIDDEDDIEIEYNTKTNKYHISSDSQGINRIIDWINFI